MTIKIFLVIYNNRIWYLKLTYQVIVNKANYYLLRYGIIRVCLHPLGKVMENKMNLCPLEEAGSIGSITSMPSYKRPMKTHSFEFVKGYSDQITMYLALMTFLHELTTIVFHSHQKITSLKDLLRQGKSIHMSTANCSMYLFKKFCSFCGVDGSKKYKGFSCLERSC